MNTWVSKDDCSFHMYVGADSICKTENLLKPFAKKYSLGNHNNDCCKICQKITKTDDVLKIKRNIEQLNHKVLKFYQKFDMYPVDALINRITSEDVKLENILELSAKDFGGISPVDVLSDAIISKRVYFESNGTIRSINGGENL